MQQLLNNNLVAFDHLYTRHQGRLQRFFQKRFSHKALDLTQECFVRLLERRDQWKGQPFLPWFYVMAKNLLIDEYRRDKRPLVDFEKEERIDLSDWLEGLSPAEMELLYQRYFEGKSFKDLSLEWGTSEVSIRQKMSRLLRSIRGGANEAD